MIVRLMFPDRDFSFQNSISFWQENLINDLGLHILFDRMANGDEFTYKVCSEAILNPLKTKEEIIYRQDVMKDCLKNRERINILYSITEKALEKEKSLFLWTLNKTPSSMLSSSVRLLQMLLDSLVELKEFSLKEKGYFKSKGFGNMFSTIERELTDEYLEELRISLKDMELKEGMLFSARLGEGNIGTDYKLRKQKQEKGWKLPFRKTTSFSFKIHERDEAGFRALSELKDKGLKNIAETLFLSANHVLKFFELLKTELTFYKGAIRLYDTLAQIGEPLCFPEVLGYRKRRFTELHNPVLAITSNSSTVGNSLDTSSPRITFITGANQGGKTTFLSSIGISQLMMQAGIFVCAQSYSSYLVSKIFTHYKREEDKELKSGKLEEELSRMEKIVTDIEKNSLVLFNESFASTNEAEGSEIAKQILQAFMESDIESIYVTHMYKLVSDFYSQKAEGVFFLRADRTPDGERTFKILPKKPLSTSFGKDLYEKIFSQSI